MVVITPGKQLNMTLSANIRMRWQGQEHERSGELEVRALAESHENYGVPQFLGGEDIRIILPAEKEIAFTRLGLEETHFKNMLALFASGLPDEFLASIGAETSASVSSYADVPIIKVNDIPYTAMFRSSGRRTWGLTFLYGGEPVALKTGLLPKPATDVF